MRHCSAGAATWICCTRHNVQQQALDDTSREQITNAFKAKIRLLTRARSPILSWNENTSVAISDNSFSSSGINTYQLDLGDGTVVESPELPYSHIYASPGDYNIQLSITSQDGSNDEFVRSVSIEQE